jgi:hypothetical protein
VVVAVGAHQIGEHLGVASVGLGARAAPIAFPIAGHRLGVDGEHLIAGRHQGGHPQTAVGLDADHHLTRLVDVLRDQRVELSDPGRAFGQSTPDQPRSCLVLHFDVVMILGPVVADEDHASSPSCRSHRP